MKVTIKAHVHANKVQRYSADTQTFSEGIEWEVYPFDMSKASADRVLVGIHELEIEVPDGFDPRPGLVSNLERERERIKGEFSARITAINGQIQNLMAIEHHSATV